MVNFDVVDDIVITSKTIFLRCNLNVPVENGVILDDTTAMRLDELWHDYMKAVSKMEKINRHNK